MGLGGPLRKAGYATQSGQDGQIGGEHGSGGMGMGAGGAGLQQFRLRVWMTPCHGVIHTPDDTDVFMFAGGAGMGAFGGPGTRPKHLEIPRVATHERVGLEEGSVGWLGNGSATGQVQVVGGGWRAALGGRGNGTSWEGHGENWWACECASLQCYLAVSWQGNHPDSRTDK
ncbi:hypothetical protein CYMTET_56986 [Cymbomonas tetramitiformis]|uniref:Uncharacterized protein n=1 Tax=Cymbomonas tetramitiformis TaxID=36881 RepID=A0AAE0ELA3_9CHLO|nr:hypothetical protein CYMTET_56986 [Cymbomonas tetramitiformis]